MADVLSYMTALWNRIQFTSPEHLSTYRPCCSAAYSSLAWRTALCCPVGWTPPRQEPPWVWWDWVIRPPRCSKRYWSPLRSAVALSTPAGSTSRSSCNLPTESVLSVSHAHYFAPKRNLWRLFYSTEYVNGLKGRRKCLYPICLLLLFFRLGIHLLTPQVIQSINKYSCLKPPFCAAHAASSLPSTLIIVLSETIKTTNRS